jgi:hypothetical protein
MIRQSVHPSKALCGYECVMKGRSNLLLSFSDFLHPLFDLRKDLVKGSILLTELIQTVLQSDDPRCRVGKGNLIAIQSRELLLGPEQVKTKWMLCVLWRISGQNEMNVVEGTHGKDLASFSHESLKLSTQKGKAAP